MGDYYDHPASMSKAPCRPGTHHFAPNDSCWRCGWTRSQLLKFADETIAELAETCVTTWFHCPRHPTNVQAVAVRPSTDAVVVPRCHHWDEDVQSSCESLLDQFTPVHPVSTTLAP